MKEITKDTVSVARGQSPRRKQIAQYSCVKKSTDKSKSATFYVEIESVKIMFEAQTELKLFSVEQNNKCWWWRYLNGDEIKDAEEWEKKQGALIYLRDCLSLSVALDMNLYSDANSYKHHTPIGRLEHDAKSDKNTDSMNKLTDIASKVIQELSYYKDADLICSVPQSPEKDFDMPSKVTSLVSGKISKQNVTSGFVFGEEKPFVKSASIDGKWDIWEAAQVSFKNNLTFTVKDKTVILIDDKYQSGTTMQYIAMKLQQAGASKVYGLCFVKTMSDTDNV